MATQVVVSKFESEELDFTFDMLSRCAVGESIVTAIVSVSVSTGIDLAPESMVSGVSTVSNNVVIQKIIGGVGGVIYDVACSARSSLNNIFINVAKLAVLSDNAAVPPEV
jgi:hypothetical protein